MTTYELSGPFVSTGPMVVRGGRIFAAWKRPGEQRNMLFEVKPGVAVTPLGYTPGTYYKDGECSLAFDDLTGELYMLNFCSPDPATGGAARPVLWKTGIVVAGGGGTVDSAALAQLAAHEARLDRIAAGAAG